MKDFIKQLPSKKFWLANTLFWLGLTTIAASHTHRVNTHYERQSEFIDLWLQYLPWWGNWIFVAPFIIASTATIATSKTRRPLLALQQVAFMLVIFFCYWGLTTIEITLMRAEEFSLATLKGGFSALLLSPLHMDFLVYLTVFGLGCTMSYHNKTRQQALHNEQLAKQLVQVELASLKSQLNPHFLFNTLNTIASLIRLDKKQDAIKALTELSQMLRKVLEHQSHQLIPLAQEIDFIKSYLTIQQMRFEHKLNIELTIDEQCLHMELPFMLLQPLVENAVQHGSQLESDHNHLKLEVRCQKGQLLIKLVNLIAENDEHQGFGIGINNCQQRLEKMYSQDFTLTLSERDDGYFETLLIIPQDAH